MHSYYKGLAIEQLAAQYLQQQGMLILERNFHCKYGELDLIGKTQTELVFIEVRYRNNSYYGSAAETITYTKQKKIIIAANYYLSKNNWATCLPCRIDVIAMSGDPNSLKIEWIQNAICI